MAIIKDVILPNGVTTSYHRVARIDALVNEQVTVEVQSYTSREKREEEIQWLADARDGREPEPTNVYIHTTFYELPYKPGMSVDDAYVWLLSNVKEFRDAEKG